MRDILINLISILPMKPSEFKICISDKSYNEKTIDYYRNYYVVQNILTFKIIAPKFNSTNDEFSQDCVKISRPYFLYFLRNKPSKSVTIGPGWVSPVEWGQAGTPFQIIQLVLRWS